MVIALQTRKESEQLFDYFYTMVSSILMINKNGAAYFRFRELLFQNDVCSKEKFMTDAESYLDFCQVLIYTPCVKTGVSIQKSPFNMLYAIASQKSSITREFQ